MYNDDIICTGVGDKGTDVESAWPGSRQAASTTVVKTVGSEYYNSIYVFGGTANPNGNGIGTSNDLWKYQGIKDGNNFVNEWTWLAGGDKVEKDAYYVGDLNEEVCFTSHFLSILWCLCSSSPILQWRTVW
jgi:hypothetical protein